MNSDCRVHMTLGGGKGGQFRYIPLCQPQPGEEGYPLQLASFSASLDMPSSSLASTDPNNTGKTLSQLIHMSNSQFPESFYNQQLSFSSCRTRCTISRDSGFLAQAAVNSKRKEGGPKKLCETMCSNTWISAPHLSLLPKKGQRKKTKYKGFVHLQFRLVQLWDGMNNAV